MHVHHILMLLCIEAAKDVAAEEMALVGISSGSGVLAGNVDLMKIPPGGSVKSTRRESVSIIYVSV